MNDFIPEYEGDTPNRKWVRDLLKAKGEEITLTDVVEYTANPERELQQHDA